jgi:site-specific DNA-methyltransferase (adenine-specific)
MDGFEEKMSEIAQINSQTKLQPNGEYVENITLPRKNVHPTVKPTELMLYLIKLVTPKGGTVMDCFMGSGSTGKAAVKGGFDFIGIEREEEYYKIAEARISSNILPMFRI